MNDEWNVENISTTEFNKNISEEEKAVRELFRALREDVKENYSCERIISDFDGNGKFVAAENFEEMGIKEDLLKGLYSLNFDKPSKIQKTVIPAILKGRDIIYQSESGSGKTITFAVAMLNMVKKGEGLQAVVLSPTRELNAQNHNVVSNLAATIGIRTILLSKGINVEKIEAEIIFSCPGSLLWFMKENIVDPKKIKIFVADESDVLMDLDGMGSRTIKIMKEMILAQKIFLSATYSDSMLSVIKKMTSNAATIIQDRNTKPEKIKLYYLEVKREDKIKTLMELYDLLLIGQSVVFVATRRHVDRLRDVFISDLHSVSCIHGEMEDTEREKIVEDFRNSKTKVLISTDLFARGIDIPQVNLIINFDLPIYKSSPNLQTYLNRIGRSGRFGRNGFVIDFVSSREDLNVLMEFSKQIKSETKKISMEALRKVFNESGS